MHTRWPGLIAAANAAAAARFSAEREIVMDLKAK
jgi:hypothetical protein